MLARIRSWLIVGEVSPASHSSSRSTGTLAFLAAALGWKWALSRAQTSSSGLTIALICSPMGFAFTPLLYYPARIAWILEASSLGWARGGPDGRNPARPVPATFNRAPEYGKSARHTAPPRALPRRGFTTIREWWLAYPPRWPAAICRTKSGMRVPRGVWLRPAASRAELSPRLHWGGLQAARPSPACAMLCHVARRAPSSGAFRSPRFPASSRTPALHPHPGRARPRSDLPAGSPRAARPAETTLRTS